MAAGLPPAPPRVRLMGGPGPGRRGTGGLVRAAACYAPIDDLASCLDEALPNCLDRRRTDTPRYGPPCGSPSVSREYSATYAVKEVWPTCSHSR